MDNIINDFIDNGFLDFYLDEKQKNFFREIVKNINKAILDKPLRSLDSNTPKEAFIRVFGEDIFNKLF